MTTAPSDSRTTARWLSWLARIPGAAGLIGLVLPLAGGALLIWQASLLAGILDRAIVGGETLAGLSTPIVLFGCVFAARIALGSTGEIIAARGAEAIKQRLRTALVRDLLGRQPTWTAGKRSGALSALVIEQVEAVDGYFARYLPAMVQAAVLPLAFAAVCFPVDWMVGVLFLATAPLIPVFMALAGLGAEAATRAQSTALLRLGGRFADRLRGLTTLKLFGRAEAEAEAVRSASDELRVRTMRVMRIAFLSSAVLEFFAALGVAGVALYIGLTLLDLVSLRGTPLTLSAGLFCLLMAPEVYQPLRLLAANYHDRASAKAAAGALTAELGALPDVSSKTPAAPEKLAPEKARPLALALAGVAVQTPSGRAVITSATIEVTAGSQVALLGPSGSGKSTLLEAIARLRDFTGTVALDGRALADFAEAELRDRVVFLGQRPRIFAGTIADNIRLGRADACPTAVAMAARRAAVDCFAGDLPLGLETVIGENGVGLSGGEIQRVALARIYLRDPGLILLDEPTAHLDHWTENRVLDGLIEFARNRTLIVATHSPIAAIRMTEVYRIAGGQILPAVRPARRSEPRLRESAA